MCVVHQPGPQPQTDVDHVGGLTRLLDAPKQIELVPSRASEHRVNTSDTSIRSLDRPGDLGWVVMAHGEVYANEFGWDRSFETLVARIVAAFGQSADNGRRAGWIAEEGGKRLGCVLCVDAGDDVAQLRLLLVHPDGRGRDLGRRLVDRCVAFAESAGYRCVRLWTNHPLAAARAIYLERGFVLVDEQPHHSFGLELVGQTYELDLEGRPS